MISRLIEEHKLDVFLAPEWVFLPRDRIYSREEKERIVGELAERTSQTRALILPGTFMWEHKGKVRNSTPVVSRGRVIKEYLKHLDGGTRDIATHYGFEAQLGKEKGTAFRWDGLNVGLEICADHGCLKGNEDVSELDLHIVLSCGMSLYDSSLKVKESRYGLLCDGCSPCSKIKRREQGSTTEVEPVKKEKAGGADFAVYEILIG